MKLTGECSTPATARCRPFDLNEVPVHSNSSPIDVVRAFHDNPDPSPGFAATIPGEEVAGGEGGSLCGACGGVESRRGGIACDSCERVFHLRCLGMRLEDLARPDWLCFDCMRSGAQSSRWSLGFRRRPRLLDLNAPAPTEEEEECYAIRRPGESSSQERLCFPMIAETSCLPTSNGLAESKQEPAEHIHKRQRLVENHSVEDSCPTPAGTPLCSRLPSELVGDFYEMVELLRRFDEILGLKAPVLPKELEEQLVNPCLESFSSEPRTSGSTEMETEATENVSNSKTSTLLTKVHSLLLDVLISELQIKVGPFMDGCLESGELKSKRGRKKDVDITIPSRISKPIMLPMNELTWPELARRYILAILSMDGNVESGEVVARESRRVYRCLQGDGGVLCGSIIGVAGMKADAIILHGIDRNRNETSTATVLAEATDKVFSTLKVENPTLVIEEELSDDDDKPEWMQCLEPVRSLATNVGSRIRNCVHEALGKGPPEWARSRLEHSISKAVYKGNASGPTKRAVISVLDEVRSQGPRELPRNTDMAVKRKVEVTAYDIVVKQCRTILRQVVAADEERVVCSLLTWKSIKSSDKDDGMLFSSDAMASRPLDFATIDLRLAAGAYGGSHKAFLEEVRELWGIARAACRNQDQLEMTERLSEKFESLYKKEVVPLIERLKGYSENTSAEIEKEVSDSQCKLPEAPWDGGSCKICGVDQDYKNTLLCDKCNGEHHTYCLDPPLSKIPEGNWYCPSCHLLQSGQSAKQNGREVLAQLATAMEQKEYCSLTVYERTCLLKFLCDELISSDIVRVHLEQCAEMGAGLRVQFLGRDSLGRLYWASALADNNIPHIVVDECLSEGQTSALSALSSYQTHAEIQQLMAWLNADNLKERKLKEAIGSWKSPGTQNEIPMTLPAAATGEETGHSNGTTVTRAAMLLEKKYGPYCDSQCDSWQKQGKAAKVASKETMFRCTCLELIWPSRKHCTSCHKSFPSEDEHEEHENSCSEFSADNPISLLSWLKCFLLDIEAALPEEAIRPSKAHLEKRWAWRTFVKSAETIYEMVQAVIVLEATIKTTYLKNEWWYWSSYTAASKTSTIPALALRIYSLDASIRYEKPLQNLESCGTSEERLQLTT